MIMAPRHWVFLFLSALAWLAFTPLYAELFSWAAFSEWINWLYLPHGLRVLLVLLFGLVGAAGFTLGGLLFRLFVQPGYELPLALDLSLALMPALAAWGALCLTFREQSWRQLLGGAPDCVARLNGRQITLLSVLSALFNSVGHVSLWGLLHPEMQAAFSHYLAMLFGDLCGAFALLYALKFMLSLFRKARHRL